MQKKITNVFAVALLAIVFVAFGIMFSIGFSGCEKVLRIGDTQKIGFIQEQRKHEKFLELSVAICNFEVELVKFSKKNLTGAEREAIEICLDKTKIMKSNLEKVIEYESKIVDLYDEAQKSKQMNWAKFADLQNEYIDKYNEFMKSQIEFNYRISELNRILKNHYKKY